MEITPQEESHWKRGKMAQKRALPESGFPAISSMKLKDKRKHTGFN